MEDELKILEKERNENLKNYTLTNNEDEKQEYWQKAEANTLDIASLRRQILKDVEI